MRKYIEIETKMWKNIFMIFRLESSRNDAPTKSFAQFYVKKQSTWAHH